MRRVGLAIMLALGMVVVGASPSWADPTPAPTASGPKIPVPKAEKPTTVCTIGSGGNGAIHITGLVATKTGYVVIDGANTDWPSKRVVYLNSSCVRTSLRSYSGSGADDPQDLAMDSKGVLWVADTGDDPSAPSRKTIALWKVPTGTGPMTLYRFSYPDSPQNTEALLLNGDGTPIFVTKTASGPASIYVPDGPMSVTATTPLKKVGVFAPEQTGTDTKFGLSGENWVTGGANSPDGKRVVLRTYSDAYEWNVTNGDVIGAITSGTPRITPLPDDTQGEAIAYTPDGTSFLTVSNTADAAPIYQWKPAAAVAVSKTSKLHALATPGLLRRWFNALSLTQLMGILGGTAALGLLLVIIGILGIRRSRTAIRAAAARAARAAQFQPDARVPAGGPGVYGAPRDPAGGFYPAAPSNGYDPYSGYPAPGRYPPDPYAAPGHGAPGHGAPGHVPPGTRPAASPPGGQYGGGWYAPAVDPYDDEGPAGYPPADYQRPRPPGRYPGDDGGYGDYRG